MDPACSPPIPRTSAHPPPPQVGGLRVLVLCYNVLNEVSDIHRLQNLRELDLTANHVCSWEQVSLMALLPHLEQLCLEQNPIAGENFRDTCLGIFSESMACARGALMLDGLRLDSHL